MTSGKQARRQRQEAARPPVRSTEGRRASPAVLLGALAGLAGIVVAVVLVLVFTGGGSGDKKTTTGTALPDSDVIAKQFSGIPQEGNVLGAADAPVTLVEYIDLQCPVCRQFETETMPTLIDRYVRPGKVKVVVRPIAIIGPDSERGRRAMIAAEPQGKAFNFSQILYFNQGPENGGWLDQGTIADAAVSVGLDPSTIVSTMNSKTVAAREQAYDRQARADAVAGTPTIGVGKTGGKITFLPAGDPGTAAVRQAIERALK